MIKKGDVVFVKGNGKVGTVKSVFSKDDCVVEYSDKSVDGLGRDDIFILTPLEIELL